MTTQFKKFLISLLSVGLGIATLYLLALTIPNDAGLAVVVFAVPHLVVSAGGIFIYYFLIKKIVIKLPPRLSQDLYTPSPIQNTKKIYFFGILLAILQFISFPALNLFSYNFFERNNPDYWKTKTSSFFSDSSLLNLGVSILGFFFFPYILTRSISDTKRLGFILLYFLSPLIIAGILTVFN